MAFLHIFLIALILILVPQNEVDANCCCCPCCNCAPCCNPPLLIKLPRTCPCCCCCKPCCCCCCGGGGGGRKKRDVTRQGALFPRAIFPKPSSAPLDGCDCRSCSDAGCSLRKRREVQGHASDFQSASGLIGCALARGGMLNTEQQAKAPYANIPPKSMMDRVNPRFAYHDDCGCKY